MSFFPEIDMKNWKPPLPIDKDKVDFPLAQNISKHTLSQELRGEVPKIPLGHRVRFKLRKFKQFIKRMFL